MAGEKAAVRIEHAHLTPVRHPIKSARLLYSAPSWVLAGPIYLIAIIVMTAMVYSFWATKDELVVAPLRLERESVTVQSVVSGMVSRINVREGDSVETLDSLMEVQKTRVTSQSEQETLSGNKRDLENELDDLVREYDHKSSQLRLQMDDIKKTGIILRNQLSTSGSSVRHLVSKLRQAEEALKEVAALYANHDVTKAEWLRAQGKVDDLKKNLSDTKIQYDSALAELKNLETQEAKLNNETAQNTERFNDRKDRIMERLKGVKKKMTEEKSLVPGVTHQGRQTLYDSTFSGLVTQVHVKPGQLVDPDPPGHHRQGKRRPGRSRPGAKQRHRTPENGPTRANQIFCLSVPGIWHPNRRHIGNRHQTRRCDRRGIEIHGPRGPALRNHRQTQRTA
jgi:multidrug resistance efflux pump